MIIGDFNNWEIDKCLLSPVIVKALDYVRLLKVEEMADGIYSNNTDGSYLVIKKTDTIPFAEAKPEKHERYIDVHYIISGNEKIGFARDSGRNKPARISPIVEDHTFFASVEHEMELTLYPGQFVVFLPSDLHRPWCRANGKNSVRKALFKVPLRDVYDCVGENHKIN